MKQFRLFSLVIVFILTQKNVCRHILSWTLMNKKCYIDVKDYILKSKQARIGLHCKGRSQMGTFPC